MHSRLDVCDSGQQLSNREFLVLGVLVLDSLDLDICILVKLDVI